MIRRNQLSAVAVTQVLVQNHSQFYTTVVKDPWMLRMIGMVSDRSLDFVRAALLHRESLGATAMTLDEQADLTPVDYETFERSVASLLATKEVSMEEPEEGNHEEEGMERSRKRGRDHDDNDDNNRMEGDEDEVNPVFQREEQIFIANEAVKRAIRSARMVYQLLVETFFASWSETGGEAASAVDPEILHSVILSLLSQTWRGFFGFQQQISSQYQQRVIITEALTNEMRLVLQQQVPSFYETWRSFLA